MAITRQFDGKIVVMQLSAEAASNVDAVAAKIRANNNNHPLGKQDIAIFVNSSGYMTGIFVAPGDNDQDGDENEAKQPQYEAVGVFGIRQDELPPLALLKNKRGVLLNYPDAALFQQTVAKAVALQSNKTSKTQPDIDFQQLNAEEKFKLNQPLIPTPRNHRSIATPHTAQLKRVFDKEAVKGLEEMAAAFDDNKKNFNNDEWMTEFKWNENIETHRSGGRLYHNPTKMAKIQEQHQALEQAMVAFAAAYEQEKKTQNAEARVDSPDITSIPISAASLQPADKPDLQALARALRNRYNELAVTLGKTRVDGGWAEGFSDTLSKIGSAIARVIAPIVGGAYLGAHKGALIGAATGTVIGATTGILVGGIAGAITSGIFHMGYARMKSNTTAVKDGFDNVKYVLNDADEKAEKLQPAAERNRRRIN